MNIDSQVKKQFKSWTALARSMGKNSPHNFKSIFSRQVEKMNMWVRPLGLQVQFVKISNDDFMNDSNFAELVNRMPEIPVKLEWEHDGKYSEGKAALRGEEVESGDYLIYFDATIIAYAVNDKGDRLNSPSLEIGTVNLEVSNIDISHLNSIEIKLNTTQSLELIKVITNRITI